MYDAEEKLLKLGIPKEEAPLFSRIILLAKSWDSLKHLMRRAKIEEDPHKYLAPIITQIYQDPLYNHRLKRITLMLRIPDPVKDEYLKDFEKQPEGFHRANRDIPLTTRNKFINATDKAVLNVIKDHLGFGPEYVIRNRISDAFDNP